ncbi:MAG: TonB-dependent receptor domain-containing protein, partial [Bacilli bacterium]
MKKEFVMKKRIVMWLSCVVLLMSGAAAIAQTITGAVRGTVTDPSGAVVPGAKVTATNVETGVATSTTSNRTGLYNFQFLSVGHYTITATAKGFSTVSVGPFTLNIDQTAMIDTKLQVGKSATTVKVAADTAPLLNTENATVNTVISANMLKNMPMNGQNVNFATLFVPGAIDPTAGAMGSLLGTERAAQISGQQQPAAAVPSFSGNRQQGNDYILDGIEMNETIADLPAYNPSPFAVQEINVVTGDAGAQYGNAAGSDIVMLTKAGTNKFHGNAWEYFENQSMTANTWQNNDSATPTPKTQFTQNQFGAAVGGPIIKNKLFFFGDYSGMHYSVPPSAGTAAVPDAKMSGNAPSGSCPAGNADLSELLAENVTLDNNSSGTASATAYPNNCIPIVNPVAKYLFSHPAALPGPNQSLNQLAGAVTAKDYLGTNASYNANNQGDVRLDYTLNSKNSLMGKYTYGYANDQQSQAVIPVFFPMGDNYPFQSAMLQWVHTFSPSLVNSARGGFSRIIWNTGIASDPSGLFGTHGDQTVGFGQAPGGVPYLTAKQLAVGFASLQIGANGCSVTSNMSCVGTGTNANGNLTDNNFDYADDLTWEHGNHITRFGLEAIRYQENFYEVSNQGGPMGSLSYTGAFSQGPGNASGYADFVLDDGLVSKIAGNATPFAQRQWRDAAYAQDDWKALPNLTINAGVRLIYDQPLYEVHNRMASINLPMAYFAPASLNNNSVCGGAPNVPASCYPAWFEFAGQNGNSRALYNNVTAYNDFAPRLGFDWQVNHHTVIRGGYGITDDMEGMGYGLRMTQNEPFLPTFTHTAGVPTATSGGAPSSAGLGFGSTVASGNNTGVFKPGQGQQVTVWDPNLRPAMIQQFNLTAQYLINNQTSIAVGYVGEIGQHLVDPVGINQFVNLVPGVTAGGNCPDGSAVGPNGGCAHSVAPYFQVEGSGSCENFLIETQSNAIENYNALQVVVQHQQSNGLEYTLNYTYSKSMTDNPG